MKNIVVYIHGKGGSAQEAAHFQPLFADSNVLGFDYEARTPREAKEEFVRHLSLSLKAAHPQLSSQTVSAHFLPCMPCRAWR
ncbi:hypothetical protein [Campylobacter showae]|uniref:hypothetical protein n=1 Tax=Campylobacter showae TaxID=204 RepID=UPI001F12E58C|nr:hypothetical protein [Campylobacter showae]